MARLPRLNIPGIPQHVIQRGNNRQPCFYNDIDKSQFLKTLFLACNKHQCLLHAYVLMSNHVHFLITPLIGHGISHLMMDLGRKYVRYINDTYDRTGTLWEGRFKSSLVDSTRYCLACYRYIELNPVRAKIVNTPEEYTWSSFRANALGVVNELISPHEEYLALGKTNPERRNAYLGLFSTILDQKTLHDLRFGINRGLPVGRKRFKRMIETKLEVRLGTGKQGRRRKIRSTSV